MRAGTITLRLGERLVAIGCDTAATLERCRERFAAWIDESQPDIEVAFDVRIDTVDRTPASRGAPRPVPQLRLGSSVIARSRSADDVIDALDAVLGGVLARQDDDGVWLWLRAFVSGNRIVLVDAAAPMLVNDPELAKAGIVELPAWSVAIMPTSDGNAPPVRIPAPLTDAGSEGRYELAGMVGVMPEPPSGDAALLALYGTRHTSADWFRTANSLIAEQQLLTATDRITARRAISQLLH